MVFKALKLRSLCGYLARPLLWRALFFVLTLAMFPLLFRTIGPIPVSSDDDHFDAGLNPAVFPSEFLKFMSAFAFPLLGGLVPHDENENLTMYVFREIMGKGLLDNGAKALCMGEGSASAVLALRELDFTEALGVDQHPFFSLLRKHFLYELNFKDNSFDFVFSRSLDKASVPAMLVLEMERVLRPGGTGAMLVGGREIYSGGLIRSATPVSSFLKSSSVVHVIGVSSFTLVIFKKNFDNADSFEHYRLPDECPSVKHNKPIIKYLEPLVEENSRQVVAELSYLPKFMNISSRNRFIYINIGAAESVHSSITNWFMPLYPKRPQAFSVYVVDHDTSVITSHVKKPGITFVYYPGLAGNYTSSSSSSTSDEEFDTPLDDEGFDFVSWFKETVAVGDLVVLAMNAREVELNLLFDLFESGAICHVDELFLRCSNDMDHKSAKSGDCSSLFKSLRNSGVYVHQWWGD